jgi:very-short-patch-repair endonuclease
MKGRDNPNWKEKIRKVCPICGKSFEVIPSRNKAKFCSIKCRVKWDSKHRLGKNSSGWKGGMIEKQCLICGKKIKRPRCDIKTGRGKFCSHSCKAVWITKHAKKKNTSIELKVEEYLKKIGVKFESQKVIPEGRTIADFYIPEQRLVIYADGKYWHGRPEVKNRDQQQDFQLGFNGYKVLRLGEDEINSGKFSKKLPYRAV